MQLDHVTRRDLIALLAGTAVTWPIAASAQPSPKRPLIA